MQAINGERTLEESDFAKLTGLHLNQDDLELYFNGEMVAGLTDKELGCLAIALTTPENIVLLAALFSKPELAEHVVYSRTEAFANFKPEVDRQHKSPFTQVIEPAVELKVYQKTRLAEANPVFPPFNPYPDTSAYGDDE